MFGVWSILRGVRRLHGLRYADPVSEDLRGWCWYRSPLKPRAYLDLGVSEVAYRFCSTKRDVWLRRREGAIPEVNGVLRKGLAIHSVFHRSCREVGKALAMGYSPWDAYERVSSLCKRIAVESMGSYDPWLEKLCRVLTFGWTAMAFELGSLPSLTEFVVDGSLLGLSKNLRVDALFEGSIVVELKYGSMRNDYTIALAGYALALESFLEIPIDFGLLIVINGDREPRIRVEPIYIGPDLRQSFIEARDEVIDILLSSIPPPKPSTCPSTCPYRKFCLGE